MRFACSEPDVELLMRAQQWIEDTTAAEGISAKEAEKRLQHLLLYDGLPPGLKETP